MILHTMMDLAEIAGRIDTAIAYCSRRRRRSWWNPARWVRYDDAIARLRSFRSVVTADGTLDPSKHGQVYVPAMMLGRLLTVEGEMTPPTTYARRSMVDGPDGTRPQE